MATISFGNVALDSAPIGVVAIDLLNIPTQFYPKASNIIFINESFAYNKEVQIVIKKRSVIVNDGVNSAYTCWR